MSSAAIPTRGVSILFRHPARGVSTGLRRRPLRAFFKEAAAQLTPGHPVTCLITDDRELRLLNRQFRRKDLPTDVLSFPASGQPFGGEMAISLERAAAQAIEFGHAVEDELRILMLHGLLHLAGMDHETDSGQMARTEARWRKRFRLPAGLVERSRDRTRA